MSSLSTAFNISSPLTLSWTPIFSPQNKSSMCQYCEVYVVATIEGLPPYTTTCALSDLQVQLEHEIRATLQQRLTVTPTQRTHQSTFLCGEWQVPWFIYNYKELFNEYAIFHSCSLWLVCIFFWFISKGTFYSLRLLHVHESCCNLKWLFHVGWAIKSYLMTANDDYSLINTLFYIHQKKIM